MISLYRKGNTHKVRGFVCEMQRFKTKQLAQCLKDGWSSNPDCSPVKEQSSTNGQDSEIRAAAKEAGIRNWHNKKIDNLKMDLEDLGYGDTQG